MTTSPTSPTYNPTSAFTRRVAQPIMLALLVACQLGCAVLILEAVWVGHTFLWLIPAAFFIALFSIYTTMWLHDINNLHVHRIGYRTAELFVLLLIMRLLTWAIFGNWPQASLLPTYYVEPWVLVQDAGFVVGAIVTVLAWERGMSLAYIFHFLALDTAEIAFYRGEKRNGMEYDRPIATHRSVLVDQFMNAWLGGGLVVIVSVALVALDVRNTAVSQFASLTTFGLPPLMVWLVCLYFLLGFALLSQGRLATLNARWLIGGARKTTAVDRNWTRFTLLLVLFVSLLAAFLPLGSTSLFGLFIEGLIQLAYWLFAIIAVLFLALLGLLLGGVASEGREELIPPAPPPTVPPESVAPASPFWSFLFGATFWTIVIIVGVSAVMFFLRERGIKFNSTLLQRLWTEVLLALQGWWLALRRQAEVAQEALRSQLQRVNVGLTRDPEAGGRWRFVRLNALSPRDKVRYFFLSTERRASEKGVSRRPWETPREYADTIKQSWSPTAVEEDVDPMTEAFQRAQYSQQEIDPDEVAEAKSHWEALRRQLRRPPQPPEPPQIDS